MLNLQLYDKSNLALIQDFEKFSRKGFPKVLVETPFRSKLYLLYFFTKLN